SRAAFCLRGSAKESADAMLSAAASVKGNLRSRRVGPADHVADAFARLDVRASHPLDLHDLADDVDLHRLREHTRMGALELPTLHEERAAPIALEAAHLVLDGDLAIEFLDDQRLAPHDDAAFALVERALPVGDELQLLEPRGAFTLVLAAVAEL